MPRLPALAVSILVALPAPAAAQNRPSLLDLFAPDRIVQGLVQSGIITLRSQMDIQYGAMSVDVAAGRIVLTDISIWPLPTWDEEGDCEISVDRLTLMTTPVDRPDRLTVKLQLAGAEALPVCLPPEPRGTLDLLGLDRLSVPRATLDVDYGVPGSDAEVALYASLDEVASVSVSALFSYLGIDGRADMENPDPVVFLDEATVAIENLGLWETVRDQLPPQLTDPASAGLLVEGGIGAFLAEMNRDAAGDDPTGDPSALGEGQRAFVTSAVEAWTGFLDAPERLVIETGLDGDTYIDFTAAAEDPRYIFDTLRPRVALAPARALDLLPAGLLRAALDAPASLSDADRRAAGLAFATGSGAPRDAGAATRLLGELARAGDASAAMALSDAVLRSDPAGAYRWALVAGAAREAGATARLDRIEAELGLAAALDLQEGLPAPGDLVIGPETRLRDIRDRAAAHLLGSGAARSYARALLWATLGAAAGDPESADILEDLDGRVRFGTDEARAAWRALEAEASALAVEIWLGGDLPSRFGR